MRQEEKRQAGSPVRNRRNWISRTGFAGAVCGLVLAAANAAGQSVPTVSVDENPNAKSEGHTFIYTITLDEPAPANGLTVNYMGCGSSSLAAQSVSPAAARQEAIGSVKAW